MIREYKNQTVFQKVSNPRLQIQKIHLDFYDNKRQRKLVDQYFFVDSRNKVQLLYPNYD